MSNHTSHIPEVTVRLARSSDARQLSSLAALDSAPAPQGQFLIAESEAHIVAALPLAGGRPIADPFRRTSALVQMLELRADQLGAGSRAVGGPRLANRLRGLLHRPEPNTP